MKDSALKFVTNYVDFEDIALLNEIFLDKNQLLNFLEILEKRIREIKKCT